MCRFSLLMPYNLLRLVDGVKPQFTWLIQTVDLSKQRHRGPSSSLWHWFWQLFRHALVCARTHTAAPSLGSCVDKWVKSAEVFLCVCARVCDRRSFCTHVDFYSRGQSVGHVYVAYCLIYFCWCARLYHVVGVHWLRACLRDANWMVIYACGVSPSPSFPRFISIYDHQKELFFLKETRSIRIASSLIRSWHIGYWPGQNEDVNYNATFLRTLTSCK